MSENRSRSEPGPMAADVVAPRGLPIPKHAWRWFLALEAVLALVYWPFGASSKSEILGVIPWMEWPGQVPAWAVLGLVAVAAIGWGTWRYRPNMPIAWVFIGFGVLLFIAGDTTYKSWHQLIGQQSIPFPSFVDAIYITMYPVLALGLLLLARARARGGDRASILDALTITLGIGLLSWTLLIGPNVRAPGGMLVRLTAGAYPLGDILVLAMLAHLWSSGGLRNTAGRLLAVGTIGALAADSVYGLANLHPGWNWHDGNPVDLGWIMFYACWGAAALHPSMRTLSERLPTRSARTSTSRLVMLCAASLIAPMVLLVESELKNPIDAPIVAVVAGTTFLFVLLRMTGLVQAHQRSTAREQVLRTGASELVSATGRDGIHRAVMSAVHALAEGHGAEVEVSLLALPSPSEPWLVEESDGPDAATRVLEMLASEDPSTAALRWGKVAHGLLEPTNGFGAVGDVAAQRHVGLFPLLARGGLQGAIALTSAESLPPELSDSVETLSVQAAMALDREAMTEAFHARQSEARFQTLVQNASDVILIVRPDTTIAYVTPSVERILGHEARELEGTRFTDLLHPDDVEQAVAVYARVGSQVGFSLTAQWRVRHEQGATLFVDVVANNLLSDPTVEGIVLTMRDVTERKSLEEELKHQAFHDALSGLANRALFRDRLEHALARASRSRTSLAVLFLDLDDFKLVNDGFGHPVGDQLLVAVGTRIVEALRGGDTAARLGGDEFGILLEQIESPEESYEVADRVINALRTPFVIDGHEVHIRASVGIALSAAGAENPDELLQAADVAMYAAKGNGKGRYEVYHPALQDATVDRLERTVDLQRALDRGEFVVHYQPIVSLVGSQTVGVEALVRWRHPERGLLLPKEFISLAEDTGLIIPLGRWVLEESCRQAHHWQQKHGLNDRLHMSVNISARHFQHIGLVGDVSRALQSSGLDPKSLVLEITESLLVQDTDAVIARMLELKMIGVQFAVDDFGTGYSSLSYLKRFPIDILKVDKSFVDDVADMHDGALAETIVQLGKTLNLRTIAEGIEEVPQLERLRTLGCQYGQGFLFAKPLPAPEMESLFARLQGEGLLPSSSRANEAGS
jgi:diguanylate cyclase (GGDEF)-like protein/PAS domain S-box-containing protein